MQEGELEDEREGYEEVHVYAERGAEVAVHREGEGSEEGNTAAGTKVKLDRVCIECSCLCTCYSGKGEKKHHPTYWTEKTNL